MKLRRIGSCVGVGSLLAALCLPTTPFRAQEAVPGGSGPVASQATAGTVVPRLVQFSGAVTDATGQSATGTVAITFSLYELQQGGTPLWSETQSLALDTQGRYTVLLGASSAQGLPLDLFTSGAARWLGIQPTLSGVGELPRVLLVGVPYALKAADADTLGGMPPSAFVQSSQSGATVPQVRATAGLTAKNAGGSATGTNGNSALPATITGTGKPNFIPLWLSSTKLSSSTLFQDATKQVGIGTTTPAATFEVNGTAKFDQAVTFASGQAFPGAATLGPNTFSGTQIVGTGDLSVTSGNVDVPATTSATAGVLNLGGSPFIQACCPKSAGNTFVGSSSGNFSADASSSDNSNGDNTAVGLESLTSLTSGYVDTAIGAGALQNNSSGAYNTAAGFQALLGNSTGTYNTALGVSALAGNSTGTFNTASGVYALAANTTGAGNTATGSNALQNNTIGTDNTGVGFDALQINTTGTGNTASGAYALQSNDSGISNTATGFNALQTNSAGSGNTADGLGALQQNTTGSSNTGIGYGSLFGNSTGSGNTALGYNAGTAAGLAATTGSNNTLVGYNAGFGTQTGLTNAAAIGANATVTVNNALVLGSGVDVGIGTSAPTSALDVVGNVKMEGSGNGIIFPDGTTQTTAGGGGTITGVTAGTGLTGGGTSGNVALTNTGVLAVGAGQGVISTGGQSPTLSLNTGYTNGLYAQLAVSNTFSGNQTVSGNVTVTGTGNGITFPDGTKQTTAPVSQSLDYMTIAEVFSGPSATEVTCPALYIAVAASCNEEANMVLNDKNSPLPSGQFWVSWLIPSANSATGVHCGNLASGQQSTLLLRCSRLH